MPPNGEVREASMAPSGNDMVPPGLIGWFTNAVDEGLGVGVKVAVVVRVAVIDGLGVAEELGVDVAVNVRDRLGAGVKEVVGDSVAVAEIDGVEVRVGVWKEICGSPTPPSPGWLQ